MCRKGIAKSYLVIAAQRVEIAVEELPSLPVLAAPASRLQFASPEGALAAVGSGFLLRPFYLSVVAALVNPESGTAPRRKHMDRAFVVTELWLVSEQDSGLFHGIW